MQSFAIKERPVTYRLHAFGYRQTGQQATAHKRPVLQGRNAIGYGITASLGIRIVQDGRLLLVKQDTTLGSIARMVIANLYFFQTITKDKRILA